MFSCETQHQDAIAATVFFSRTGCAIGINLLAQEATFSLKDGRLFASTGQEILFPDAESKQRVLEQFARNPDSVFVLESGPMGPVRDHAIAAAISG